VQARNFIQVGLRGPWPGTGTPVPGGLTMREAVPYGTGRKGQD
jgi:arginase family enzyme